MKTTPIILIGPPRSGTTLLQVLISSHSNIVTCPETHMYSYVLKEAGIRPGDNLERKEVSRIFNYLSKKPKLRFDENYTEFIFKKYSDGIKIHDLIGEIVKYFNKDKSEHARRWLEKTPLHALHISDIFESIPNARIVAITRDPRDVSSSKILKRRFRNRYDLKKYRYKIAMRWNKVMQNIEKHQNDERLLLIKYEDLINDTEKTLDQVMRHLGESLEVVQLRMDSLDGSNVILDYESNHKQMVKEKKIVTSRIGRWRNMLDSNEVGFIEYVCRDMMEKYSYKRSINRCSSEIINRIKYMATYYMTVILSYVYMSRHVIELEQD